MSVVIVAGGLGDMGRLITEAVHETGKYEVYVMSRSIPKDHPTRVSPLTGKTYDPIIQTDYSSEEAVAELLTHHKVHTVICTFALDFQAASDSQLTLIRAAERAPCVKRFMPSEFNIDYDQGDDVLPYPDKRFHTVARRELEKSSSLEFTYVLPGMFMDYFGMPKIATHLRELCIFVDPMHGVAIVPGNGEAQMAVSYTKDVARYTSLALGLDRWPRVMTTASGSVSVNELVALVNKSMGKELSVTYESISDMLEGRGVGLPGNAALAEHFPGGEEQLAALRGCLGSSVALGAYDFSKLEGHLDLVVHFSGRTAAPMKIEELVEMAWSQGE